MKFKTRAQFQVWIEKNTKEIARIFAQNKWKWYMGLPSEEQIAETILELIQDAEDLEKEGGDWIGTGRLGVGKDAGGYTFYLNRKPYHEEKKT